MKKELPIPATVAIIAVFAIVAVSVGWYYINRPVTPVNSAERTQNGNVKMTDGKGGVPMRARRGDPDE